MGKGYVIVLMIDEIISWELIFYKIYLGLNIFVIVIIFYEYFIIFIYIIIWLLVIYMLLGVYLFGWFENCKSNFDLFDFW